jgi:hypothetical protein
LVQNSCNLAANAPLMPQCPVFVTTRSGGLYHFADTATSSAGLGNGSYWTIKRENSAWNVYDDGEIIASNPIYNALCDEMAAVVAAIK